MATKEIEARKNIGKAIRRLRKDRFPGHGSLKTFAEAIGISPNLISDYEAGRTKPGEARLKDFADFFGVTVSHLRGEDTEAVGRGHFQELMQARPSEAARILREALAAKGVDVPPMVSPTAEHIQLIPKHNLYDVLDRMAEETLSPEDEEYRHVAESLLISNLRILIGIRCERLARKNNRSVMEAHSLVFNAVFGVSGPKKRPSDTLAYIASLVGAESPRELYAIDEDAMRERLFRAVPDFPGADSALGLDKGMYAGIRRGTVPLDLALMGRMIERMFDTEWRPLARYVLAGPETEGKTPVQELDRMIDRSLSEIEQLRMLKQTIRAYSDGSESS